MSLTNKQKSLLPLRNFSNSWHLYFNPLKPRNKSKALSKIFRQERVKNDNGYLMALVRLYIPINFYY